MAAIDLKRIKAVIGIADTYTKNLLSTASILEKNLLVAISKAQVGSIVDAALARAQIQNILIQSGYFDVVGSLVNDEFQNIIQMSYDTYLAKYGKSLQYSDLSLAKLDALKNNTLEAFTSLGDSQIQAAQKIFTNYQFGAINLEQATELLKDSVSSELTRYASTMMSDAISQFSQDANTSLARDAGFNLFEYIGPIAYNTREFCIEHLGEVKTWEEWSQIVNEGDGGDGNPVTVSCGGYGCQHELVPTGDIQDSPVGEELNVNE